TEKFQVASPRVLEASLRRRKSPKQLLTCGLCGRTVTARHNLTNHINSHTGKRPYHCIPQCGRSFGTKHVLKRHQTTC
ncbi:hypothetical protein GYMLUDRAFT_135347, partial [Collybiopsis luxurians FD-317 M1]